MKGSEEMIKHISEENFEQDVLKAEGFVLVDFWAPWCGPCKMLGPVLEELAEELKDRVQIVKLNVDENRNLAVKYEVMGIPTMIIFNNGVVVESIVGFSGKETLKNKLLHII